MRVLTSVAVPAALALPAGAQLNFIDATDDLGLGGLSFAHVCFVDLNNDSRPDAVVGRNRVFLNTPDPEAKHDLRFVEVESTGLPAFRTGDIAVFVDLDNDGNKDCVWTRYLDINADNYEPPGEGPAAPAWFMGNGDGTFGDPLGVWREIDDAAGLTTSCVAVGDVNRDGHLDLYLGNWYRKYGDGLEAFANSLLWNLLGTDPDRWMHDPGYDVGTIGFDEEHDAGPRPTYGVMIVDLLPDDDTENAQHAELLDLSYGRRWNRLWMRRGGEGPSAWEDLAPALGLDGDDIRHGRYPDWLKERAKTDPRFDRDDEKPFRANGNTFDAAVGDIDNDGDFDLFLAEIAHGWAGESSDRSRFLVQETGEHSTTRFVCKPGLAVDRVPDDPTIQSWNQGDIYAELADFDLDGRLDLLLCSSDYPDNQRLRIYRQQADGTFGDITTWIGIDHVGAGQPSLADVDGDGDIDIIVGQSFNRLRADQKRGREPLVRLFLNQASDKHLGHVLTLRLVGDAERGVNRDALGAIVRVTTTVGGQHVTQSRQLIGIGGHQGKQMDFAVHVGLGEAEAAERVEILWPDQARTTTVLTNVPAGAHVIEFDAHGE